jgi:serine/threonine-protein kinase ATR
VEGWPTWKRSYPEDDSIEFLKKAKEIIDWRDKNAKGKEIWLTEFGWDATTKPAPESGTFKDWVGSTETQQAQYLVRAYMVLSAMDLDRAYMYWFNDTDQPQVHGSSGLTRNYKPKPAYHAVSHLYKTLGDYRFNRVVQQKQNDLYVYEYVHETNAKEMIWAVWSPTGSNRRVGRSVATRVDPYRAERMPLDAAGPKSVTMIIDSDGAIELQCSESPAYLWLRKP